MTTQRLVQQLTDLEMLKIFTNNKIEKLGDENNKGYHLPRIS